MFLRHTAVIQASSREELRTSQMIAGKGQTKQNLFQYEEYIQDKRIKHPTKKLGCKHHSRKVLLLQ